MACSSSDCGVSVGPVELLSLGPRGWLAGCCSSQSLLVTRLQQTARLAEVPSPRRWLIDDYVAFAVPGRTLPFNGLIIGRKEARRLMAASEDV